MRVAFAGTPQFARVALAALHAAGFEIALVLTQPDRPAGRGLQLHPSPVKALALERELTLIQPRGLRLDGRFADAGEAARDALLAARPEVMVVAAYGLILPQWALDVPRRGCINIHASLLPRWRGAAPVQRAIEAGDARSGVTIMQMDAGLDTGSILLAESTPIAPDDSSATLQDRLATLGARLIVEALALAARGGLSPTLQPAVGATYARKIEKAEATIDWTQPAPCIERRLRAFDPFPGAISRLGAETVKVWRGTVVDGQGEAGEILEASEGGIVVACGEGAITLTELPRPGARRVSAARFLAGFPVAPGMRFGRPG